MAVVVPVYRNERTLAALATGVAAALAGRAWRLRFVIDASPDASAAVAAGLAAGDARVAVTVLTDNVGQHEALRRGLAAEDDPSTGAWVCMDADLQDPPAALPRLLDRLSGGDVAAGSVGSVGGVAAGSVGGVAAVFAGRRGAYEGRGRRLTGGLHRAAMARLSGLPADAGAFVALGADARRAVLDLGGPSVVAALGVSGLPLASVPVVRAVRPAEGGTSAWTSRRRLAQSLRTLRWTLARRAADAGRRGGRPGQRAQRSTTVVP